MNKQTLKNYLNPGRLLLAAIICSVCAGSVTRADVVFNNFGPGNTFNIYSGYTETGVSPGQSLGEGFSPSISGTLSLITIAMSHISGTNDLHLFLADGSTGIPGTVLESWVVGNVPNGADSPPITIHSVAQPLLSAGNEYYLYSKEPGNEMDSWGLNSIGEQGTFIDAQNGTPYFSGTHTQGAFRVEVTPVPEPASAALFLCLGLAGIGARLRRK